MEEKKINKRIVFSVVAVLLLIAVVAGATYAYFSATASSADQTVTTASLDLAFDDSTAIINATNITPIYQSEIETKATKKSFTVTNNGTENMYLKMQLTDIVMDDELKDLWFRWALYEEGTRIGMGTFYEAGTEVFMQQNMELQPGSKDYDLYTWIEESGENQNALQGKSFSGKITVNGSITEYEDVALLSAFDNLWDGDVIDNTARYYDTNITHLDGIDYSDYDSIIHEPSGGDYSSAYMYSILNDNLNMFTNLSIIDGTSGSGFSVGYNGNCWNKMPISLTSFSTIRTSGQYTLGSSIKHLTNLTYFKGEVSQGAQLPSSVTNVDIFLEDPTSNPGTFDFSNLVNLESFKFDSTYNASEVTVILPKSIQNTATINVTGATVVYQ